jgi:hypothetical protein
VHDLRGGGVRRLEVLGARERDPNRSPECERGAGDERLDDRELAAEGAAERLGDHADALEREAVRPPELALRHEGSLRARRDDERPARLDPGRRDLGLDVALVDPRRPEGGRDDGVAGVECRRRVAAVAAHGVEDVSGELLLLLVVLAAVGLRVNRLEVPAGLRLVGDARERRARLHRPFDVDDGVERLVVDHDELGAVLGRGLALGDDDRDRLAREHDLRARERLGGAVVARRLDREVVRGQDGHDSLDREGCVLLHARDRGVSVGRQDEASVQEAVHVAVGGEAGRPGDLLRRVDARASDSDHAVAVLHAARSRARSSARATTTSASRRRYSVGASSSP